MIELLGILLLSFLSALVPLVNIEAILAVAAANGVGSTGMLVTAAAVGQMIGKVLWYLGGQNFDRFPWVAEKAAKPKVQAALDRWHDRAVGRPWFTAGLLFVSAFAGVPPYAVMAVLAGVLRVPFVVFFASGLVGRALRFWVIVSGTTTILSF